MAEFEGSRQQSTIDEVQVVASSPGSAKNPKQRIHRFTVSQDVAILTQLSSFDRPFRYGSKCWTEIVEKLSDRLNGVTPRAVRERVVHLVRLHKKGQATSQKQ